MAYKRICGIYKIQNLINNKVYIGQSKNILERWGNHKYYLKNGTHNNKHLQRAWNKYGENNFQFIIIEECGEQELANKEIVYVALYDSFKNGYNNTIGGDNPLHTEETKLKISNANKGKIISEETKRKLSIINKGKHHTTKSKEKMSQFQRFQSKRIIQFNLEGNIIKVWDGSYEIVMELDIDTRSIRGCCNKEKRRYTAHGFIWLYEKDYNENGLDLEYHLQNKQEKHVIQYDNNMCPINEWKTITEASKSLKIKDSDISMVCKGKRKTAGGYIWRYK